MGYITYKQYDSRWGSKNYNGSSTMATAGCGPSSVAMLAHAVNPKVTPWTVAKYMKTNGYAIRNNGTAWSGIPAAMKHFGLTDVKNVANMSDVFKYMKKGYCAVFLFKAGTKGNVTWTTAGHYIAVTDYKYKNKKHYLYTRDSGGRNHTGWYCYETKIRGLVPQVWVGKVPPAKKTKADKIHEMAVACSWKYKTPKSKYKYPSGKRRKAYKLALKKAYGERKGWGKQTRAGASCDVAVGTFIRASGVDKKFPRGLDEQIPYLEKSKKWQRTSRKKSKLKKGYIIVQVYKTGGKHIMEYYGNNKVANAHYVKKTYPVVESYDKIVKPKSKCKIYRVYKPI